MAGETSQAKKIAGAGVGAGVGADAVSGSELKLIQEGQATIQFGQENQVFYNKVQVFNRDISIAVISYFNELRLQDAKAKLIKNASAPASAVSASSESLLQCESEADWLMHMTKFAESDGLRIFEALSATGLRSIRYFKEIPGVQSIVVNDLDAEAVKAIKNNIEYNGLDTSRVIPNQGDAALVMYQARSSKRKFDVVDLDPYGSAAPFLDAAVQSVENGGLLCVTCTDMAVLSGNHPEVCYARYHAMPNKAQYLHEMALRIVLAAIESTANRYQRHIVPIVSCCIDFYVRIFVRVYKSPANVKKASTKCSYVFQCSGCESFHLQPVGRYNGSTYSAHVGPIVGAACDQCNGKFKMSGPIWTDPIHDKEAVLAIRDRVERATLATFATKIRMHGMLTAISEELQGVPLHYTLPGLSKKLHCPCPPANDFKAALMHLGYQVSQFHKVPDALKTNAPNDVVWDIMRCWVKKHPINKKRENPNLPGFVILSKEAKIEANFTVPFALRNKEKAVRFPHNPEPYWGPKRRAVGEVSTSSLVPEDEEERGNKRVKKDATTP